MTDSNGDCEAKITLTLTSAACGPIKAPISLKHTVVTASSARWYSGKNNTTNLWIRLLTWAYYCQHFTFLSFLSWPVFSRNKTLTFTEFFGHNHLGIFSLWSRKLQHYTRCHCNRRLDKHAVGEDLKMKNSRVLCKPSDCGSTCVSYVISGSCNPLWTVGV